MSVDRGGLNYRIKVEDAFSKSLKDFRTSTDLAKREWAKLKREMSGIAKLSRNAEKLAKSVDGSAARESRTSRTRRAKITDEEREEAKALKEQAARLKEVEKFRESGRRSLLKARQQESKAAADRAREILTYKKRLESLIAVEKRASAARAAQATSPTVTPVAGGAVTSSARTRRAGNAANTLNRTAAAAKSARSEGTRLLFTFRRLFGVLALFTVAREAANGIQSLIGRMVTFNETLESANLGIAALITASGGVRDALGNTVDASTQLALAQKEARRQTALLRRDGLKTAATFEQLVDTFQIALGPGLAVGLDLDEIRKFTVQVSQAAAAAGVAQNQLSEEIRSILSGTIQQRTTRLAAVLGITNEDIRRAKEAGVLVEFLNEKFQAFSTAGEEALNTFAALASNAADAISQLLGAGGIEFFEELKGLLSDTVNLLAVPDDNGVLTPNPAAVKSVEALASGLVRAVAEARRLGSAFSLADLSSAAQFTGDAVGTAAEVLGQVIEGAAKGANDLLKIVSEVAKVISDFVGIDLVADGTIAGAVRLLTLFSGMALTLQVIASAAASLGAAITLAAVPAAGWTALLVAAGVALGFSLNKIKEFGQQSSGIEATWGQILGYIRAFAVRIVEGFSSFLVFAFEEIKIRGDQVVTIISEAINQALLAFQKQALLVLGVFTDRYKKELDAVNEKSAKGLKTALKTLKADEDRLAALKEQQKQFDAQSAEDLSREIARVATNPEAFSLGNQAQEFAKKFSDDVTSALSGLRDKVGTFLDPGPGQSKLSALIEGLAPVIQKSRESLDEQSDATVKIATATEEARQAIEQSRRELGLTGTVQKQIGLVYKSEIEQRKAGLKLLKEEATEVRALSELKDRQRLVESEVSKQSAGVQEAIRRTTSDTRRLLSMESRRAGLLNDIRLNELEILKARESGADTSQAELRLGKAQLRLSANDDIVAQLRQRIEAALNGLGGDLIGNLVKGSIEVDGQIRSVEEGLRRIRGEQSQITRELQTQEALQLSLAATQALPGIQRGIREEEARAQVIGGSPQAAAVSAGLEEIRQLRESQELRDRSLDGLIVQQRQRLEALQTQREITASERERESILTAIEATEASIVDLTKQQSKQRRLDTLELERQQQSQALREAEQLRQANLSGERGFEADLGQRFADRLESLPSAAETTFGIIERGSLALADTISGAITDAFDPESKVDLKERFAILGKQLANILIQELARVAIAKAIVGIGELLTTTAAGGSGALSSGGTAQGGVPGLFAYGNSGGVVSRRHGIQSFSSGGIVAPAGMAIPRPPGIPARDTVPAWLEPREVVIRSRASRKAGFDAMSVLNSGRFDPEALRAVLGLRSRRSRGAAAIKSSFAGGGTISSTPAPSGRAQSGSAASQVFVANEAVANRILAAGPQALNRAVAKDRAAMRSILGR